MDKLDEIPNPEKVQLGNSYSEFIRIGNIENEKQLNTGKALHYISTIEQLNERISDLSSNLDTFNSHIGYNDIDVTDDEGIAYNHPGNDKERKEVQQFSGVYAIQTTLDKTSLQKDKLKKVDTSGIGKKPMLVELHSFPGYDTNEMTPLPAFLTAEFILNVVVDAQDYFLNKPTFKKLFYEFFISKESKNVFQDSFWWFFCHKYQSTLASQDKLFDRIARNYTSLLFAKLQERNHDKYFKKYGVLISQAIYATFCHAFPTSYRQFNGEFRDEILNVCVLWTMGTKPRPRSWDDWNFEALEPRGLRKGEKLQEDAAKAKTLDFELKQMEEKSRLNTRRNTRKLSRFVVPKKLPVTGQSKDISGDNTVANQTHTVRSTPKVGRGARKKCKENPEEHLTQISSVLGMAESDKKKQSCEVGVGPTFNKVVFNVYGQSPLVTYYLSSNNLLKNVGTSVLVHRTEICKLPPVDSKTYDDVIEESRKRGEEGRKKFENLVLDNVGERRRFSQKRGMDSMNFKIRSTKLLSNHKEVKKISDLLRIPEHKEEAEESKVRSSKLRSLLVHILGEDDDH